jgi:alpha,alpha-trehalase
MSQDAIYHSSAAAAYEKAASLRARAMNGLLWDSKGGTYRDYRLDAGAHSHVVSVSDYSVPLWAGLTGPDNTVASAAGIVASLERSGLLQPGGASTTALNTGQQWDAPNAWAPLELMLVEGLDALQGNTEAHELANKVATEWLDSGLVAWKKTHVMYEKYDAFKPGSTGGGGEYHPQIGFGWTNGVALVLLLREDHLKSVQRPARQLDAQSHYQHVHV